jgi:glycosyltransferase involved in cell wall biosynthesis
MKVVFIFGGLPHYYNFILNKLNSQYNIDVTVFHPKKNNGSIGKNVYQDKSSVRFNTVELDEAKDIFGKSYFKNLLKHLKEVKPEIIVIGWPHILSFYSNPFIYYYLKFKNIKVIEKSIPFQIPSLNNAYNFYQNVDKILNENLQPIAKKNSISTIKYWLLTQFRKFQFRAVDAHVCYVEDAFEIYQSYGVKKENIFIIYNSPDTQILLEASKQIENEIPILNINPHRIVHIGRLVKWKKVHLLIEALPQLIEKIPSTELLIIGSGPEEDALVKQAAKLGISKHVIFIGAIYDPKELGRYLKASGLYVLAGTGGLSINDAMCFEKPIICSECDGTEKKLVRNNYNGFIFETDNVNDLANKIILVLSDPNQIEKMGKNSLDIIKNEVNENIVIDGYLRAFNHVVNSKK